VQEIILFFETFRPAVWPISSFRGLPGALSTEVQWPKHEADHSSPSSAEVMNEWSSTSSVYAFMEFIRTAPFAGISTKLWQATTSFVMSTCPSVRPSPWNSSAPTERIFMNFNIWAFFENLPLKLKFH
jgi:hypothetical protein